MWATNNEWRSILRWQSGSRGGYLGTAQLYGPAIEHS